MLDVSKRPSTNSSGLVLFNTNQSSEKDTGKIHLYDGRGGSDILVTIETLHSNPVHLMKYNPVANVVVSCDEGGMIEYWKPNPDEQKGYSEPDPNFVTWKYKSDTDLYEFKKVRFWRSHNRTGFTLPVFAFRQITPNLQPLSFKIVRLDYFPSQLERLVRNMMSLWLRLQKCSRLAR